MGRGYYASAAFYSLTTAQQLYMSVEQLFRQASQHFEDSNYSAGLNLMSKCIALSPKNSAFYSNRALFHSQLGQVENAVQDLNTAISHNYLNYVAYFNLFSLQFNAGQIMEAFDNLCCSLSCLYLVRARRARRELDVQRSIKYAENNPDAHILKALMYLDDGKNKLALNEIQWALDLGRYTGLCTKIKNIINRRLNPYSVSEIVENVDPVQNFRLHTSYEPAGGSYDQQMRERVKEFNQIYDELMNAEYGTVTQKVQRIRQEDPSNNQSRSRLISEISDIYEIKFKEVNTVRNSKEKVSEAPTKQQLTLQHNQSDLLERHIEETSLENQHQEILEQADRVHHAQQENLLDDDSLNRLEHQFVTEQKEKEEAEPKKAEQLNLLQEEHAEPKKQQNLLAQNFSSDHVLPIQNTTPITNSLAGSSTSEVANLYPITTKKKIQFTIISAQVKNPGKNKDFYIIGNYNSRKGQRLKTPNKKIEGYLVKWFTSIAPTPIAETSQTVTIKLFSKQYFSYDDQQIGEGEVEILQSGEMKIPVYFKNKITGFVNLRIDLI